MNTRFLKQIGQLLQNSSLENLEPIDGNLPALSNGKEDGTITLRDQGQTIIIKKLVININYASGGGAKVTVHNKGA